MKPVYSRIVITFMAILLAFSAQATKYKVVGSGNYTSSSTWKNGNVPPFILGIDDTVEIVSTSGQVILDTNIVLDGSNAYLVKSGGVFRDNGRHYIAVKQGRISFGAGSSMIDSFYVGKNGRALFTGTDTFSKITLSEGRIDIFQLANVVLTELLHIRDGMGEIYKGLKLNATAPYPTIYFSDSGSLRGINALDLSTPYNLRYSDMIPGTFINEFDEFKGSGTTLFDLEITDNADILLTESKVELLGRLILTSGSLTFDTGMYRQLGFIMGGRIDTSGTGTIRCTDSMGIYFNSGVADYGQLRIEPGWNKLEALTFNGINGRLTLTDDMQVQELTLNGGHPYIGSHKLELMTAPTTGSKGSHIKMDSAGSVLIHGASGKTDIHIGSPGRYLPVSFEPAGSDVHIGIATGVRANGNTGAWISDTTAVIEASWKILNGIGCKNVTLGWQSASEVNGFDRKQCYIMAYENGSWNSPAKETAATEKDNVYYVSRNDSFNANVFAVFDTSTPIVSVAELLQENSGITLFPNPVADQLQLSYRGSEKLTVLLLDASGKVLAKQHIVNGTQTIDVRSLTGGIYFLHVVGAEQNSTHKFVKQ